MDVRERSCGEIRNLPNTIRSENTFAIATKTLNINETREIGRYYSEIHFAGLKKRWINIFM